MAHNINPDLSEDAALPEELEVADALLDQADALLQRHRGASSLITATGDDLSADDLPLLTEVVDHLPTPAPPTAPPPEAGLDVDLAERLVALDGLIAREVESWIANELPELLAVELERVAQQLKTQAQAQLRATLLPALSQHISATLDPLSRAPHTRAAGEDPA